MEFAIRCEKRTDHEVAGIVVEVPEHPVPSEGHQTSGQVLD